VQLGNEDILRGIIALPNNYFLAKTHDKYETVMDISVRMGTWEREIGDILRKARGTSPETFRDWNRDRMPMFQLAAILR